MRIRKEQMKVFEQPFIQNVAVAASPPRRNAKLRIREEQEAVFSKHMLKQFEDRTVLNLRIEYPEQTKDMSEESLRSMIHAGIKKAEAYEVTDETDVERFLNCMICYGPEFDVDPKVSWAGEILKNEDLSGFDKMNQINDYEVLELSRYT